MGAKRGRRLFAFALGLGACDRELVDQNVAKPGVQHPACSSPMPDPLPTLPHVKYAGSVPEFALWQGLGCDDPMVDDAVVCGGHTDCPSQMCVDFGDGNGICSFPDIDLWCDGEGGVIGSTDGACWMCIAAHEHARACCDDVNESFDCRQWPFANAPGGIGQVCATHEDCEGGLACSEPYWALDERSLGTPCSEDNPCAEGTCSDLRYECVIEVPHYAGYGICACPGTDHAEIVPSESCG